VDDKETGLGEDVDHAYRSVKRGLKGFSQDPAVKRGIWELWRLIWKLWRLIKKDVRWGRLIVFGIWFCSIGWILYGLFCLFSEDIVQLHRRFGRFFVWSVLRKASPYRPGSEDKKIKRRLIWALAIGVALSGAAFSMSSEPMMTMFLGKYILLGFLVVVLPVWIVFQLDEAGSPSGLARAGVSHTAGKNDR